MVVPTSCATWLAEVAEGWGRSASIITSNAPILRTHTLGVILVVEAMYFLAQIITEGEARTEV